jgi:hypothetical protein
MDHLLRINTFDIDGVINLGEYTGLRPAHYDVIITGRALEEANYTLHWLKLHDIHNRVFFNNIPFDEKTREKSGYHKARTINELLDIGYDIGLHFEDDEIQAAIIEKETPIKVVRIVHDLVEKENVWHGPDNI